MSGKSKALPTIVVASAGIAAGAAVAFAGFLLKRRAVRTTCKPFYAEATRRFKIPGISEGFVPQDLFYLSDEQTWLFSGYLANRRPSPIYQVGADGTVRRHEVRLPEGSLYRRDGAPRLVRFPGHPAGRAPLPGPSCSSPCATGSSRWIAPS